MSAELIVLSLLCFLDRGGKCGAALFPCFSTLWWDGEDKRSTTALKCLNLFILNWHPYSIVYSNYHPFPLSISLSIPFPYFIPTVSFHKDSPMKNAASYIAL